jgi:4-diphosphocytidyl-2-C-methyl-D-erythritol kinase
LEIVLNKSTPMEAGLGGGSSNAAAALLGAIEAGSLPDSLAEELAPEVGADVALFLRGGTQMMSGVGERLETQRSLGGFAVAVVVPEFGLSTADVFRRWDELEGPEGEAVAEEWLPPALRGGMPMRNDLVPAAIDLEPRLGDFMADVRTVWDAPVLMTGSGSACFGFFGDVGEATDAAEAVVGAEATFGVELRDHGVARVED